MSTDMPERANRTLVPVPHRRDEAMARIAEKLQSFYVSPDDLALQISLRILESETPEDILAPQESVDVDDWGHKPFWVRGFVVTDSSFDGGLGYYAILDCEDTETGESFRMTCGAANIVAQVGALAVRGFLPVKVIIERSTKATARGFYPLSLRPWSPEEDF